MPPTSRSSRRWPRRRASAPAAPISPISLTTSTTRRRRSRSRPAWSSVSMASSSTSVEPGVVPAGRRVSGRLAVPPSKSGTHRAFNLALLAGGDTVIERPLDAEDTRLFLGAVEACGMTVERRPGAVRLRRGAGVDSTGGGDIFCGNAGTMLRFLTATLAAWPGRWRLDGVARLRERPVGPLVDALRQLGAAIEYLGRDGYPPLVVEGGTLRGGRARLDAGESSQYLSALLLAGQRASAPLEIEVSALVSAPYVELTRRAVAAFGGHVERRGDREFAVAPSSLAAGRVTVEGDYSAACYAAAAAALTGGRVALDGLDPDSAQGDRGFLELLGEMGARVSFGPRAIEVAAGGLRAVDADLGAMPDQVPTLAALAPFAEGTTRIRNVRHLRIKESDRLAAMAAGLRRLGATVEEEAGGLVVPGVWARRAPPSTPVEVDPQGDHRIAMSLALVGLRRPGVRVRTPEVVAKSYPGFWRDLAALLAVESSAP